jgi:hypothetical protein
MAHELSHTLGAVQYSSPHTSRGAHCIDEWDVMCYSDEPFHPKMKFLCDDGAQDFRLDCNNDDYYASRPSAGSYLDTHWNAADSPYLTSGPAVACADAGIEPDDAYWYWYWDVPMRKYKVGNSESHAFCHEEGDTDWVMFEAKAGTTYEIATSRLAAGVDSQLVLYRGFEEQGWNGMDEVASNDDRTDGDRSSRILYTAPSDESYLVGIADAEGAAARNHTYVLSIRETGHETQTSITLTPSQAHRGEQFNAVVTGFRQDEKVTLWVEREGNASRLGDTEANNDGIADDEFRLPGDLQPRVYQIQALGDLGSAASASMKVIPTKSDKHKKSGKQRKPGKHKRRH